jgi:hypothetical protein
MELDFTKGTDTKHKIRLESHLVYVEWLRGAAPVGRAVDFVVGTSFVGDGAPVTVTLMSESKGWLGQLRGEVSRDRFTGEFTIPDSVKFGDMLYLVTELNEHGLRGESRSIAAVQPVQVSELKWSVSEARRGDNVTLSAKVINLSGDDDVKLIIYEHDQDGGHDRIVELPATIEDNRITVEWEYQYHEDTDDIPSDDELSRYGRHYQLPEYFFTVKIGGEEFGRNLESGLLTFKDSFEFQVTDDNGAPISGEDYILILPDGTERKGKLDDMGRVSEENVPPGKVEIRLPNLEADDEPSD